MGPNYSIYLNLINKDEWSFHFVDWNLDNFVLQLRTITFSAINWDDLAGLAQAEFSGLFLDWGNQSLFFWNLDSIMSRRSIAGKRPYRDHYNGIGHYNDDEAYEQDMDVWKGKRRAVNN